MKTSFISSESGAVTVDWVVLTAALVGLGLATMAVVSSGVENVATDINTQTRANNIITTTFERPAQLQYVNDYVSIEAGVQTCDLVDMGGGLMAFQCTQSPDVAVVGYRTDTGDWLYKKTPDGGETYWEDADGNRLTVDPVIHPDGLCSFGGCG